MEKPHNALELWASMHTMWPRGVTVSTLDSESSNRGSNPREALATALPTVTPDLLCDTICLLGIRGFCNSNGCTMCDAAASATANGCNV